MTYGAIRLLFLMLALAWPVAASAQAPDPDQDRPEGRYALGSSVTFTPALVLVAGHDSNAIRTSIGEPASEFYAVPQIEGWVGRGRVRLNFADAVEYSQQQRAAGLGGQAGINQYHVARLSAVGARLGVEGHASYRNHYAPPTDFVGFLVGIKSRRVEKDVGADVVLSPGGRMTYRGRFTTAQLRYDADARFRGVSLEKNLNRNLTNFGGEAQLAITPMSSAAISVTGFRDRFLFAPDRDGNGINILGGVAFSPRALITGRAEVGYLGYTVVQTGKRYGSPGYDVGLSYGRTPFFFNVAGRRGVEYSFDPGQGFYLSNGIEALATVTLGTAWELFGRGTVRQLTPQGNLALNEPSRTITVYKAGLARKFGDTTKIGADVEHYVWGGGGGFRGLRATVFVAYGTTRLLRLDRPLPGGF